MSYITAIGTANPEHRFSQATIADFMLRTMTLHNGDSRKLKTIFKASGIEYRHSVIEDYGKTNDFSFYSQADDFEPVPTTEKRINLFRANAVQLSKSAVENLLQRYKTVQLQDVTHLVVVCCTGMYAPGLDIDLVKQLQLKSTVQRTAVNFMGCYAAFNALKIADAFCKSDPSAKVLIVCTELCSLHFQREGTDDNILANALFGDGSAALLVEHQTKSRLKLKLENFHSDLSKDGEEFMAWTVGDLGFEMKLSAYVPDIIRGGIKDLTDSLLKKISKSLNDIKHFAIHPGGRKILQAIETELGIDRQKNSAAYKVLEQFGNMSSPTVLFVLNEVINSLSPANKDERILSFAFGPGLTLESMVLNIESI
ncbi:MAG TPA: type III polyketide synthase [Chryseosolibacter sp.]